MSGSDTFICHPSYLRVNFLLCSFCFFFLCVCLFIYTHINTYIYTYIYIHSFWSCGLCPPQLKLNHQPALLVLKTQNAKCSISVASCLYIPHALNATHVRVPALSLFMSIPYTRNTALLSTATSRNRFLWVTQRSCTSSIWLVQLKSQVLAGDGNL